MTIITGPKLPQHCIDGSMVSSSNGKEAILVGCKENPEKIYRLRWSNETILEWILMRQKLKYPRSNGVVMLIPDTLTYCRTTIVTTVTLQTTTITTTTPTTTPATTSTATPISK